VAGPRYFRTDGIVLRRVDVGEADAIVTLLTPFHGKLRALARGARRPGSRGGGHLDLFTHVTVQVARGRNLDKISQADTLAAHAGLRTDLLRYSVACAIGETADRFSQEAHEDHELYDSVVRTLGAVAEGGDPELEMVAFGLRLLNHSGYRPHLAACGRCGDELTRVDSFHSPAHGGVICPRCGPVVPGARPLSANALAMLRLLQSDDLATARRVRRDAELRREVEAFVRAQTAHVLERDLASLAFLQRVRQLS